MNVRVSICRLLKMYSVCGLVVLLEGLGGGGY